MKNSLAGALIFLAGSVAGFVVSSLSMKKKYEKIANEEIKSVKDAYKKEDSLTEAIKIIKETEPSYLFEDTKKELEDTKKELEDTKKKLEDTKKQLCFAISDSYNMSEEPYLITPESLGEDGYRVETLTYYSDGVLCDNFDNIIEGDELVDMIGVNSLNSFGVYEDDSVFVRNERHTCDYEILRDLRSSVDVLGEGYNGYR